MTFDIILQAKS